MAFFGLDRIGTLLKIIKFNGGLFSSLYKLYIQDELKIGKLMGQDKYGNKYYQNERYFIGRNRWVEYAPRQGLWYDGSQIPSEWFGWMHHQTDLTPDKDHSKPCYSWLLDHTENPTGTPEQFYPYSTTRPKIEAWKPPKNSEN